MITYPPGIDLRLLNRLAEQRTKIDSQLTATSHLSAAHPVRKALTDAVIAHLAACEAAGVSIDGEPAL